MVGQVLLVHRRLRRQQQQQQQEEEEEEVLHRHALSLRGRKAIVILASHTTYHQNLTAIVPQGGARLRMICGRVACCSQSCSADGSCGTKRQGATGHSDG